ncbi:salicylate synthase [Pseudoalteromonas sp. S4498]|uniref:salicylate synthase n=1 Tax=Pseudoalteromonas TaxID=53246 RepID=UPI0011081096|nr:salicylate synthase [Pseudoalteromonas galatheae]MCG9760748.1 salicylate synthase [Pseudoalteromonas sp. Isolate6]NKC17588.1 salicylate synthase [Pseudoalteromonas galatheae]
MNKGYLQYEIAGGIDASQWIKGIRKSGLQQKELFIYEDNGTWQVGLGCVYEVSLDANGQLLAGKQGALQPVSYQGLSTGIEAALEQCGVKNPICFGFANFELAYLTHGISVQRLDEPSELLRIVVPQVVLTLERDKHIEVKLVDGLAQTEVDEWLVQLENVAEHISEPTLPVKLGIELEDLHRHEQEYKDSVQLAIEKIKQGAFEKVILSRRVRLANKVDMINTFVNGRLNNTPVRSFMFDIDGCSAAGYSPELVVKVDVNRKVYTQPLAGTRALGNNAEETWMLKQDLLSDPKEIAEHAMSVRLSVEELEAVCDKESVIVDQFMHVVERGTVQHLASMVVGELSEDKNKWDAFIKLFPAVTASGIDKLNSVDFIRVTEPEPRKLYSGSVFMVKQDGCLDAALVLRSIFNHNGSSWLQAGAGIVKNSRPEREFVETCEKMSCVANYVTFEEELG